MDEYIVLDTETTGLDPAVDALVEIAAIRHSRGREFEFFHTLIAPGMEMSPVASGIHHLTDATVAGAPAWDDVRERLVEFVGDRPIVAHNAKFDRGFLAPLHDNAWICTHRLARHIWPEAPGFANQTLRYWLRVDVDASQTHRALDDARVTAAIFRRQFEAYARLGEPRDAAAIVAYAERPCPIVKMPFGKHKGTPLQALPGPYIAWAIENLTGNLDVTAALRGEIRRRENPTQGVLL